MAHFTVIGLGRFGIAASLELIHLGHTVTGVDRSATVADKYVEELTQTVICDATDENALRELDLSNSDAVLVAIGADMQSSLLCTLSLKNIGVREIWVKASTKAHHTIVSKLGVSRIIHPEEEMGMRVAQALHYPMVHNYLALGHGMYVVEVHVKSAWQDHSLSQILERTSTSIDVLLLKRDQQTLTQLPLNFRVQPDDILLLSGSRAALTQLAPRLV
ncbi:potassium channel family protein [Photobacterium atrarenae]|uniref:TrkA family potassium uptake protein n=1 Tax=Photobacterium atrarenae TaxID=865757 RepID=A0ABY5GND6_9GAMM|nr:TrkA family potassium uptake protein [Photobacterium atrarenae]UTV30281.1 TrkA family potassium uptake protein [Photobacterium atrarenae]